MGGRTENLESAREEVREAKRRLHVVEKEKVALEEMLTTIETALETWKEVQEVQSEEDEDED